MRDDVLELLDTNVMQFDKLAQSLVSLESSAEETTVQAQSSPVTRPKWSDMFKQKVRLDVIMNHWLPNLEIKCHFLVPQVLINRMEYS